MFEKNAYVNLLEESFPGMKSNILRCEALGFPWASKPFLKEKDGEVVSYVGFLEYPMLIEGKWHKVGALHAICTKAAHRGQGFATKLIQEALKWAEKEHEFLILYSEIPKFYERLSFRCVQEHRFHLNCKSPAGKKPLHPLTFPKDNALFLRCFEKREPVSNQVWVKDDGTIASYNTLFATFPTYWSLYHSSAIDGLISYRLEGKTLHLMDVVAKKIPPLDLILDHLPEATEEIYFYFPPDRFTKDATAEPYLYDNSQLMVHGPWPSRQPFMISLLSRC